MDAQAFKDQFDEDGYVILRDFIPVELMDNARLALERIVDALAEERVASGGIPHAFKDEPFELRFKKLFENEPEAGLIQFTSELHQPEYYDLYTYRRMLDLAQSYLGDVLIFQNLLFHQGSENHSLRWNADFRYQDARQPTLTSVNGDLIRSRAHPEQVISSREEWPRMSWS